MPKQIALGSSGRVALIDDCDFEKVSQYQWTVHCKKYASAMINNKRVLMHRLILSVPEGLVIDHINGVGSDNRRENLRICSLSKNLYNKKKYKNNKSGYKGVYKDKNSWRAEIHADRKKYNLGSYAMPLEAALAYDRAALVMHGEYAKLNFL